ncbi:hypothetical protein C6Q35_28300 [Burkholderia multivorans]|nr:hypothetical protein C6Q35_28300 [Burkholderia multivorans]
MVVLAGCTSTCPPPSAPRVETKTRVVDTACDWTKPIYLDRADVLSDATARAILEHNRSGARVCGWKPLTAQ